MGDVPKLVVSTFFFLHSSRVYTYIVALLTRNVINIILVVPYSGLLPRCPVLMEGTLYFRLWIYHLYSFASTTQVLRVLTSSKVFLFPGSLMYSLFVSGPRPFGLTYLFLLLDFSWFTVNSRIPRLS